jgi:hypothetical protein
MEISYEDIDLLIRKIALGRGLLFLDNNFIHLHHPDNSIKTKANLIREHSYKEAITSGLLPKKDLEALIFTRGIFSAKDEETAKRLKSKIEAQEFLLAKTQKVRANQDRIKKTIYELQNELNTLLIKKHSKLYMSADNKADEDMYSFMCSECVLNDLGHKYWASYKVFTEDRNTSIKNTIFSAFMELVRGYSTETIRYIARNNLWRVRYTTSLKIAEPLFGIPLTDYTSDQLNLIYWSNYYEQIYSMLSADRPPDNIIDDDVQLDIFMNEYYKELNNEATIRRNQKNREKSSGTLSALDAEEVIITQSSELYHDIEYDKPREAQKIKDRIDIKKKAIPNKANYIASKQSGG